MSKPTNRAWWGTATPIASHAMWLITSTALIATALGPQPAAAASDTMPLLAGERPLAESELAQLRGGFFTAEGLEISFGFQVLLDIDDRLALSLEFGDDWLDLDEPAHPKKPSLGKGPKKPAKPASPKLKLALGNGDLPATELDLGGDGGVEVRSGTAEGSPIDGGNRYTFGNDVVANVVGSGSGATVEASVGDDLPVKVRRTGGGVEVEVGDEASGTRIVDHISPSLVASSVVNRRRGADVDHRIDFDINLLNFSELTAARAPHQNGRRMQRLVDRGLIHMLTPR